jgi:hypothetical protein
MRLHRLGRAFTAKVAAVALASVPILAGIAAPASAATFPPNAYLFNDLKAVACPAQGVCFAVGESVNPQAGLITKITPTSLTPMSVPVPAGYSVDSLTGISCPSATSCIAVGIGGLKTSFGGMVTDTWNGSSWSLKFLPLPDFIPSAVACGSPTYCLAGGYTNRTASPARLALFNGTTWTDLATPAVPKPFANGWIHDVACPGPTSCLAVGELDGSFSIGRASILFNEAATYVTKGTTLSTVANGTNLLFQGALQSVRCASPTSCVALGTGSSLFGFAPGGVLTEKWNGVRWTAARATPPANTTGLTVIGCPSTTTCSIVGQRTDPNDSGRLVTEVGGSLTGTTYAVQPIPNLYSTSEQVLVSGTCFSATDCYAVGNTQAPGTTQTGLVAHFNGTSWTQRALLAPA